ncbi:MAG: ion transporter [Clostridia bacterium]|nr:ion transporter [Clostridia bacterium]
MREKLYKILEVSDGNNLLSTIYDYFMIIVIIISLIPLALKKTYFAFEILEIICLAIFIIDYLCRWLTADYLLKKKNKVVAFIIFPFTFMAIVDMVSILPSITLLNNGFKLLRLFRLFRAFRVFRVFKAFRYSKNIRIIINVLKNSKRSLITVGTLAIVYIIISALIVFNVEPDSFNNFFDAIYWATISLTTVGYGDIYPVTICGRVVTMISSVLGIAIVALPAGIITAGYMKEIENVKDEK